MGRESYVLAAIFESVIQVTNLAHHPVGRINDDTFSRFATQRGGRSSQLAQYQTARFLLTVGGGHMRTF